MKKILFLLLIYCGFAFCMEYQQDLRFSSSVWQKILTLRPSISKYDAVIGLSFREDREKAFGKLNMEKMQSVICNLHILGKNLIDAGNYEEVSNIFIGLLHFNEVMNSEGEFLEFGGWASGKSLKDLRVFQKEADDEAKKHFDLMWQYFINKNKDNEDLINDMKGKISLFEH